MSTAFFLAKDQPKQHLFLTVGMDMQPHQQQLKRGSGIGSSSPSSDKWGFRNNKRISWIFLIVFVSLFRVMRSSFSDLAAITTAYARRIQQQVDLVQSFSSTNTSSIQHQTTLENTTTTTVSQSKSDDGETESLQDEAEAEVATKLEKRSKVAYVINGHFSDGLFKTRVVELLNTCLKDQVVFAIIDQKHQSDFLALCDSSEEQLNNICKRIIPIHVHCGDTDSLCCSMDKGMAAIWRNDATYDWYVQLDQDMYIRTAFMEDFLSGLSPDESMVLTSKTPQTLQVNDQSHCSTDMHYIYPHGDETTPMVYSRAALRKVSQGFEMNAVTSQCTAAHINISMASANVHWMYGLPHVRLPLIPPAVPEHFHSIIQMIGLYGAGNDMNSNATTIHRYLQHREYPLPPYKYQWHKPTGFLKSETYQKYGDVMNWTEWHKLSPSDCQHNQLSPREVVKTKPFHNKTVAYIAFGSFQKGSERFHTMIIDSLRTWLENDVMFYVLNKNWETSFEEACQDPAIREECKRVIPIFVDCPEGYYGQSPCCKMDKGMTVMWEKYSHYDWYSYQDDDMYIRTSYMNDFLSSLPPDEPMVLTCKGTRQLGVSWGDAKMQSNCSSDMDYMYPWGQPAMYSRAGLERMSKAFQLDGVAKQCASFGVTHDAGNPIVHWMVGLPEVRLPMMPPTPPLSWTGRNGLLMGAHGVGKPNAPNISEVHALIGHVRHPQPPYEYKWHRPKGFLQTSTYKLHGNVSEWKEWHTMNVSDCRGPVHLEAN